MKKKLNSLSRNIIVPNTGVKYSKLLEQFISPFVDEFNEAEYPEDIFDFAINAWNFGNIRNIIPEEEFIKAAELMEIDNLNIALLNKMVDYKISKFKEFRNFIVDYEYTETNADPILTVTTQEEDVYLSDMLNKLDNEVTQDNFEENYINRIAIILKPKQPFLDWYSSIFPEHDFESEIGETNIYLIDDTIDDIEKWLKKKFDKFFMLELDGHHDNKKDWPQKRNYKMFNLWFRVEISEMIYDLEKRPVLKNE